jgi:AbiV family abortive infection protein
MTSHKLDQYKGTLTADQIAAGMNAADRNAKRLLADAKVLLDAGRFPSAAALAILSIEESGKDSILRGLVLAGSGEELKQQWREYRSHTKKNVAWILPRLAARGARSLDDLRPIFDEQSDHPYVLDQVKQISFYTDCLGKAHWSIPDKVIDESLARTLVQTAEIFSRARDISAEEIELWIEHLGPVWHGPHEWVKRALVNWHKTAVARGLISSTEDAMEQFVNAGLGRPLTPEPEQKAGSARVVKHPATRTRKGHE